jgi:protein TonB
MKKLLLLSIVLIGSGYIANAQDVTINKSVDTSQIFNAVMQEPQFPGGQPKFDKYIAKNQNLPELPNNTNGIVFAQFVVEKDGTLSNFSILRSQSDILSTEAIRLLKQSPLWNPGTQNGKAVRVRYTIPIRFKIN